MCECIPCEIWESIDKTFLEPSCGNGNFLVEILRRKLKLCTTATDVSRAYASIYGIDLLADNVQESKDRMLTMCPGYANIEDIKNILDRNIICGDSLEIMKRWEHDEKGEQNET
jgi:hypothetical protein